MKTIHTSIQLEQMTIKQLKHLVLGICVVNSTKELKKIIPIAREVDLRSKYGWGWLYQKLRNGTITTTTIASA